MGMISWGYTGGNVFNVLDVLCIYIYIPERYYHEYHGYPWLSRLQTNFGTSFAGNQLQPASLDGFDGSYLRFS